MKYQFETEKEIKNCNDCPIKVEEDEVMFFCPFQCGWIEETKVRDDCPLVLAKEIEEPKLKIVRCKDCSQSKAPGGKWKFRYCEYHKFFPNDDDYCSYGEARQLVEETE